MIKIAVVDDEPQERETLCGHCKKLQQEISEELAVHTYASGEELLAHMSEAYDLIFLDIDMEGMDGLSAAREIRRQDDQVILIFVTNMAHMAIKGYEVQALDFIVKPVNYYSFALKMRTAIQIIRSRKSRSLVIVTPGGVQKISTEDLYYAEIRGHYLCYHTKNGSFEHKASLKELEERLEGLPFKRCNNCYLVNLAHVDCVNRDDLTVGGDRLKISRPRKKEFLQALANYMGGISL